MKDINKGKYKFVEIFVITRLRTFSKIRRYSVIVVPLNGYQFELNFDA